MQGSLSSLSLTYALAADCVSRAHCARLLSASRFCRSFAFSTFSRFFLAMALAHSIPQTTCIGRLGVNSVLQWRHFFGFAKKVVDIQYPLDIINHIGQHFAAQFLRSQQ